MIENVYWSSCKVPFSLVRFARKVEFSRQNFEKYSNFNFHEIPSSGSRVPCGQTDGRTYMTKLLVAFHNFAKTPKNKNVK
jgi:hypothetical protein